MSMSLRECVGVSLSVCESVFVCDRVCVCVCESDSLCLCVYMGVLFPSWYECMSMYVHIYVHGTCLSIGGPSYTT